MSVLRFAKQAKRLLDICDRCHFSAYVDEGRETLEKQPVGDTLYTFICKACLGAPPEEG